MPPRFHVPGLTGLDAVVALPPEEAAHLVRVLRLGRGDTVAIFDGRGVEYLARVEQADARRTLVIPYEAVSPPAEPSVALTVAHALLKGRKLDTVVRDVTMVGAAVLQPIITARTGVGGRDHDRWTRIAIASAKQCRRAVVPEVRLPVPFRTLVSEDRSALRLLLVEPDAAPEADSLRQLRAATPPATATLAVGPEGGWSAEEIVAARAAGFLPMTFGRRTLRADAVVVCAVSVLQYIWGDL